MQSEPILLGTRTEFLRTREKCTNGALLTRLLGYLSSLVHLMPFLALPSPARNRRKNRIPKTRQQDINQQIHPTSSNQKGTSRWEKDSHKDDDDS